jgi:hypothetical protein
MNLIVITINTKLPTSKAKQPIALDLDLSFTKSHPRE